MPLPPPPWLPFSSNNLPFDSLEVSAVNFPLPLLPWSLRKADRSSALNVMMIDDTWTPARIAG
jgi:hypothetical protein